jgi:NAD(P)-dependent dehydrogenase (short-subunit alcohol dehydrogenase family)
MTRLINKVALITGGASGLGEAIAQRFVKEGAKVVVADLQEDKSIEVVANIKKAGGEAFFIKHDITNESQWLAVVSATLEVFGKLDILVNNAGIMYAASLEDTPLKDWQKVMEVNLGSVFLGMKSVYAPMKQQQNGTIINISSTAGASGTAMASAYAASKSGVISLTRSTALEWAPDETNIRVNTVLPGPIETPIYKTARGAAVRQMGGGKGLRALATKSVPMGHMGVPQDIAAATAYLASDEAQFVTGSILTIDGGWAA